MKAERRFDVAISFAGEDRQYAREVASALKHHGVAVFYDEYEQAKLWGANLYDHLTDIYQSQATYCVMFLSKNYSEKVWTNHERKAAQARAFSEHKEYILPVRLDDTEISSILPTIGYVTIPPHDAESIAHLVLAKLGRTPPRPANSTPALSQPVHDASTDPRLNAILSNGAISTQDKSHQCRMIFQETALDEIERQYDNTQELQRILGEPGLAIRAKVDLHQQAYAASADLRREMVRRQFEWFLTTLEERLAKEERPAFRTSMELEVLSMMRERIEARAKEHKEDSKRLQDRVMASLRTPRH